jgi:hypothetical protein
LRLRIAGWNAALLLALSVAASAGQASATRKASAPAPSTPRSPKQEQRRKFVLDVVRMAVALPQPDPQDRLRVLNSAAGVAAPLDRNLARSFGREGARLEAELIRSGQTPAVSLFSSGNVGCAAAANFVEALPATSVQAAEESLLGAISTCPRQTDEPARLKLTSALDQGIVAARPLLALMEHLGVRSRWSEQVFVKMFDSLPSEKAVAEAPNFAAMYDRMAPEVGPDAASDAGLKMLEWLGKLDAGPARNLSVNIVTDAMRQALGQEKYSDALSSDPVAQSMAQTAGQPGEIAPPEEENVSVLKAMADNGKDQSESLASLPASLRAREAAAHGFASGTAGDAKLAARYFDMAYSAVEQVWSDRTPEKNVAAIVEEVSESAAQVDAVTALERAQGLQDPSAQAIAMLAVARVVVGQP